MPTLVARDCAPAILDDLLCTVRLIAFFGPSRTLSALPSPARTFLNEPGLNAVDSSSRASISCCFNETDIFTSMRSRNHLRHHCCADSALSKVSRSLCSCLNSLFDLCHCCLFAWDTIEGDRIRVGDTLAGPRWRCWECVVDVIDVSAGDGGGLMKASLL